MCLGFTQIPYILSEGAASTRVSVATAGGSDAILMISITPAPFFCITHILTHIPIKDSIWKRAVDSLLPNFMGCFTRGSGNESLVNS